jgi:oxazoline/thiazoline synthase
MLEHPALRPEFRAEVVATQGVLLLSERKQAVLSGILYPHLLGLLDGSHTADAIVDLLAHVAPAAHVYLALTRLEAGGYLIEAGASGDLPSAQAAFWSALSGGATGVASCPPRATVAIAAFGDVDAGALHAVLTELGLRVDKPGDLTIALTDDPLHEGLSTRNRAALANGRPWLLVKPAGTVPWIGPLFRPGITACWECLAHRLRLNRPAESFLKDRREGATPAAPVAAVPASIAAVCALAAIEVGKTLAGAGIADGVLTTLDLRTLETGRHIVVRRPQCQVCGERRGRREPAPVPLRLERGVMRFTMGGGDRTATPEQILSRYGHHVSPITGVVPGLTRLPLDDDGRLHVYSAGLNPAMATDSLQALRAGLRGSSSGKGLSEVQARASALCEALERYSGRIAGDETLVRASYRQLGEPAIHPNVCMLFSEAQYRDRARWNMKSSGFQYVPEPFDETAAIDWVPIWSLTRCAFRYLPASFCYFDARGPGAAYCRGDSNGNAAGNTGEEAILQGFFELVERDAVAVWWYNRIRRPSVDLDSFASRQIDDLRAAYGMLGRELWVLDLTHDLGIPTFVAVSRRTGETDGATEQIVFGFGSHVDAQVGVTRALTEMNQFVAGIRTRDARPSPALRDRELADWLATATLESRPYLTPADEPRRRRCDFPTPEGDDLRDAVRRCQALVEGLGLEMLVLDQTRPDIALPVVKVVVPGLRHFWARFAPGRLYEVPVRLGWREGPAAEGELNPVAMFL